jgi:hypothetical protein
MYKKSENLIFFYKIDLLYFFSFISYRNRGCASTRLYPPPGCPWVNHETDSDGQNHGKTRVPLIFASDRWNLSSYRARAFALLC